MMTFRDLLRNFFTHKDFLPPPKFIPGTLFDPLQIVFCTVVAVFIVFAAIRCAKKSDSHQAKVFFVLWLLMALTEPGITLGEMYAGRHFLWEWGNMLPLWPCSIFLYAAPFAIWGKGNVRTAACGYICTLGLLGGLINFIYPATYIRHYSCISMAGFRTIFYHGSLIFVALTMLLSGYHSYRNFTEWKQLLLPAIPALIVSIPANIVNFTVPRTDYMFFKMESFFFAPIGRALPDWLSVILVYALYLVIHALPYLPAFFKNRKNVSVHA